MILEANSPFDIDNFVTQSAPFKQGYKVTPVLTGDELVELAKKMARANQ